MPETPKSLQFENRPIADKDLKAVLKEIAMIHRLIRADLEKIEKRLTDGGL